MGLSFFKAQTTNSLLETASSIFISLLINSFLLFVTLRHYSSLFATIRGIRSLFGSSIQFTLEREKDRHLPFLDLNVCRAEQGNLETSVYRKPTHTDKYFAFDSHHRSSFAKGKIKLCRSTHA